MATSDCAADSVGWLPTVCRESPYADNGDSVDTSSVEGGSVVALSVVDNSVDTSSAEGGSVVALSLVDDSVRPFSTEDDLSELHVTNGGDSGDRRAGVPRVYEDSVGDITGCVASGETQTSGETLAAYESGCSGPPTVHRRASQPDAEAGWCAAEQISYQPTSTAVESGADSAPTAASAAVESGADSAPGEKVSGAERDWRYSPGTALSSDVSRLLSVAADSSPQTGVPDLELEQLAPLSAASQRVDGVHSDDDTSVTPTSPCAPARRMRHSRRSYRSLRLPGSRSRRGRHPLDSCSSSASIEEPRAADGPQSRPTTAPCQQDVAEPARGDVSPPADSPHVSFALDDEAAEAGRVVFVSPVWNRLQGSDSGSETDTSPDSEVVTIAGTTASNGTSLNDGRPPAESESDRSASGDEQWNSRRFRQLGRRLIGRRPLLEPSADDAERREQRGLWQHNYSCMMTCLTCTIGVGGVCRFALFGGTYGVAFVLQFGLLSLVLGIPLMTLHMSLGQYCGTGILDLWKISPICKGIGLAIVLAELMLAVYTVVPTAWMFIYLRDSFVSSYDRYKWATCPGGNCTSSYTETITYSVPEYLNTLVLQRDMSNTGLPEIGTLGFEISFNLAIVWILVYLSLGRGVRFYGKVVYIFVLLSVTSFIIVCIQLLSWTEGLNEFFTDKVLFDNVFWRAVPWVVAARETFLVWGLHGAALMAMASHNKFRHCVLRDTTLVALITLVVLSLSALFGYACLHALRVGDAGYIIGSSSFETEQRSRFLIAPGIGSSHSGGTPPEVKHYTNLVSGVIIRLGGPGSQGTQSWRSGYQVHRLATELFPSLLAVVGGSGISSFWALVFYLALILFGIGQQLVIWRALVEAVVSVCPRKLHSWELTATFILCVLGFGLSLPLMTEIGIHVIYFLDYCVGSIWWLSLIYALELMAVLYVRGAPFSCGQLVTVLISNHSCVGHWTGLVLSLVWLALPPALLTLSVVSFRTGDFGSIFHWDDDTGYGFWSRWTRQLGSALMLTPLALMLLAAVVQTVRFVSRRHGRLRQRLRSLYHADCSGTFVEQDLTTGSEDDDEDEPDEQDEQEQEPEPESEPEQRPTVHRTLYTDAPPKYTPPPSYGTATGTRLAKMVRQSMRRSMRRLRQMTSSAGSTRPEPAVPSEPPPSYDSLRLEPLARRAGPSGGHQRSCSLALPPPEPPVRPPQCRSLPRDLTPRQVREILRTGRLRPAAEPASASASASASARPLSRLHVRQTLRGARPAADAFELTGVDETLEETAVDRTV